MADSDFLEDKLFDPNNLDELKIKMEYYLSHENSNLEKEQEEVRKRYDWHTIVLYFNTLLTKI